MEKIVIVDENDMPIGLKERGTLKSTDIYRVSGLWLSNSNGEILIAQRAFTKKNSPGCWGPAASGTIAEGETYESNILKEAEEELGLKLDKVFPGRKYQVKTPEHHYFAHLFFAKINGKPALKLQPEEVVQAKWVKLSELAKDIEINPSKYTPTMPRIIEALN